MARHTRLGFTPLHAISRQNQGSTITRRLRVCAFARLRETSLRLAVDSGRSAGPARSPRPGAPPLGGLHSLPPHGRRPAGAARRRWRRTSRPRTPCAARGSRTSPAARTRPARAGRASPPDTAATRAGARRRYRRRACLRGTRRTTRCLSGPRSCPR